jgi:hypothetical protein
MKNRKKWLTLFGTLTLTVVISLVAWAILTREPAKYPVTGSVVVASGKPADGAVILFHPVAGKTEKAIVGKANENGEFTMTTDQPGDGVEAGEYTVTVVWTPPRRAPGEMLAEALKDGKAPPGMPKLPPFLKSILGNGQPDFGKLQKLLANGPPAGMTPPPGMPNMLQPQDKLGGRYADPMRSQIRFTVMAEPNVMPPITLR